METKTLWKKNIDSKFISGEDLHLGMNGLRNEMNVVIEKFSDQDSFDQKNQAKLIVTGLFLKEVENGKPVYKPTVLNKTNAKFFVAEFGSAYMEDWIGKPVKIYAQIDKRFGYVVRFKKYQLPMLVAGTENFNNCKKAIDSGNFTIEQIKAKYIISKEIETLLITK